MLPFPSLLSPWMNPFLHQCILFEKPSSLTHKSTKGFPDGAWLSLCQHFMYSSHPDHKLIGVLAWPLLGAGPSPRTSAKVPSKWMLLNLALSSLRVLLDLK
jgi:hypothetical protein